MADIRITTNNRPRLVVDADQLTPSEREWFDYLDWPAIDAGRDSASFIRYRGQVLDLSEFQQCNRYDHPSLAGWDGYVTTSYFDGLVIRFVDGYDRVVVGHFYVAE